MVMWLCRAGRIGEYESRFLEDKRIYCTWDNLRKPLTGFENKQDLLQYFDEIYPGNKIKTIMNWASQVWPFSNEMKVGETVILPSKIASTIHVGRIIGEYEFHPNNENRFYHSRKVEWFAQSIPKSKFDQDILYSFGAYLTIFRIRQEERVNQIVKSFLAGKEVDRKSVV